MSEASKKLYGFILIDESSKIKEAYSSASYEKTLDGKLKAVDKGWTYVPMDILAIIKELKKADIYDSEGDPLDLDNEMS